MHVPRTDPYPWPYDGHLDPTAVALVLAGWDHGWATRARASDPARLACTTLAEAVAAYGGLVVTVHHGGIGPLALPIERAAIAAHGIDGFHGGPLDDVLRRARRTHLLVAGLGLEGPVHSTLRSANDRGYECLLVTDATAPLTDELVAGSLSTVTMSGGIFGALGTSADVLATLAVLAAHPTPAPTPAQETA